MSTLKQELLEAMFSSDGEYLYRTWNNKRNLSLKNKILDLDFIDLNFQGKINFVYNEWKIRPVCLLCKKYTECTHPLLGIEHNYGFRLYCSTTCSNNADEVKTKKETSYINHYNAKSYAASDENKLRIKNLIDKNGSIPGGFNTREHKKSILKKYGHENPTQCEKIKNKIRATNIERYGKAAWNPKQTKKTHLERYGVEYPAQCEKIKNKIRATNIERYGKAAWNPKQTKKTMLEKYGVEHPMHNVEIFNRCMTNQLQARYKFKEMTLPSGKIVKYQGYENYVISYLLNDIAEDDMALERIGIPTISYVFEGKERKYFPDIFIKSKNMLIEVKSTYTFDREINKNLAKQSAAKDEGYHHIIIVWCPVKNGIAEVY